MTGLLVALYVRVSTGTQVANGDSLEEQECDGHQWAVRHGHTVAAVFSDPGLSGTLPAADRPGLTAALESLAAGAVDVLLVRDLDRLARELTVQEAVLAQAWSRPGVRVFTFHNEVLRDDPDDPMRTAMRQMAGVFAQLQRGQVVKQLRDARKAKARKGQHANGTAPYGWQSVDGELIPVHSEQAVLRVMRTLAEQHTQGDVARLLNEAGQPSRKGGKWTQQAVSRVLHREANRTAAQVAYQSQQITKYEESA